LAATIDALPQARVVAEAANGLEALEQVRRHRPNIVVMDLHMPVLNGIEATRRIVAGDPDAVVVVLTMLADDASVFSGLEAGARGYLLKEADRRSIARALEAAASGDALLGGAVAERVLARAGTAAVPQTPVPMRSWTSPIVNGRSWSSSLAG
jgi:DNA-binding NarL/FixJ family response regulator